MLEEFVPGREKKNVLQKVLSHVYLTVVVLIGFVLFRCDTLSDFGIMISRMIGAGTTASTVLFMSLLDPVKLTALIAGVVFSIPVTQKLKDIKIPSALSYVAAILAVAFSILCLSSGSYNPFIYFRF